MSQTSSAAAHAVYSDIAGSLLQRTPDIRRSAHVLLGQRIPAEVRRTLWLQVLRNTTLQAVRWRRHGAPVRVHERASCSPVASRVNHRLLHRGDVICGGS